jgi:hypothetical protein
MGTLNPNWNIVGDNPIKRVFKIPVGNLSQEEAEKLIKKMMGYDWEEEIRKQTLIDRKLKIDKIRNGI